MSKIAQLKPGVHYSNEDIFETFLCSPQGGMRRSKRTNTLVLIANHAYSIYKDRWNDGVLNYTGMGKKGNQVLDGNQNITLFESNNNGVEVHLFEIFNSRIYTYKGQVQLADKPFIEKQDDFDGWSRDVWVFPLKLIDSTTIDTNDKEQENSIEVDEVSEVNLKSISLEFFVEKYDVLVRVRNSIVAEATNSDLGTLGTLHDFISSNELRENLLKMPNFGKTSLINLKDCINELIENERLLKEFANICNNTSESLDTSESLKDLTSIEEMLEYEISNLGNKEKAILKSRNLHKPILTLEAIGKTIGVTRERVRQINSKSLRKIRYSLTYKKYNKKDLAYYFKEELDNFFFSENSFISLKTAKECLKTEPEPTSIQLFIQIMSNNLNNFLHEYYFYSDRYLGWYVNKDELEINRIDFQEYPNNVNLNEVILKSNWPINFDNVVSSMMEPQEVVRDKILKHSNYYLKKVGEITVIKLHKISIKDMLRYILRKHGDEMTLYEVQKQCKKLFDRKLTISNIGSRLGEMPDALIVDRGKYNLYENLSISDNLISDIRNFVESFLFRNQQYISSKIICKKILDESLCESTLLNGYSLLGILQDDENNRFDCKRGLMIGLNTANFNAEKKDQIDEVIQLLEDKVSLSTNQIVFHLSEHREVLNMTIENILKENADIFHKTNGNKWKLIHENTSSSEVIDNSPKLDELIRIAKERKIQKNINS